MKSTCKSSNLEMYWINSKLYGDRRKLPLSHFYDPPKYLKISLMLIAYLFFLCGIVSGNKTASVAPFDWINSVPFKSIPTKTVQEVEKWKELQGQLSPSVHPVDSSDEMLSKMWYESHKDDPRIGFFYSMDSTSGTTSTTSTPEVTRPSPYQGLPISAPANDNDGFLRQGKKESRKTKSETSFALSPSFPTTAVNALTQKWKEVMDAYTTGTSSLGKGSEMGRTFFITPLLAYLFPVFLAQMFGMGMIPAAAIIMLPIFLLPLGLAAAVFLI